MSTPNNPIDGPLPLSPREREVLVLLATGATDQAISDQLGIAYHTARMYVRRIFHKLGVRDRRTIVALAVRLGLRAGAADDA
jgi:DNA-binding CsgD family transcriptional regulator